MVLTQGDVKVILEALKYANMKVENTGVEPYGDYPSYAFKCERLNEIHSAVKHMRDIRDAQKEGKA